MRGYPKHINSKQDLINLLETPEFKTQALADLRRIYDNSVSTTTVKQATELADVTNPDGGYKTKDIENPTPEWKLKGFISLEEVEDLISTKEGKI